MKNPTLQDVLSRRQQIKTQIASLNEEDQDLAAAEKALLRLAGMTEAPAFPFIAPASQPAPFPPPPASSWAIPGAPPAPTPVLPLPPLMAPPAPSGYEPNYNEGESGVIDEVRGLMTGNETLEQLTLLLFENCSDVWWTATEIQSHLSDLKGKEVPMGSISPMLTAMKNAGTIIRKGHDVALATKAMEEATK